MLFLELLAAGYVIFLIIVLFLSSAALPRGSRLAFFKLGALVPFVTVIAVLKTTFSKERPSALGYDDRLASIEERIESKRVEIFGGQRLDPSISRIWELAHNLSIERAMRTTVRMSRKIVGSGRGAAAT